MFRSHRFRTSSARVALYLEQGGRCDACDRPTWERKLESRTNFRRRVFGNSGIVVGVPQIEPTNRQLDLEWLSTYEHVVPASQIGSRVSVDEHDRMTCSACNAARGTSDYAAFKAGRPKIKPPQAYAGPILRRDQ